MASDIRGTFAPQNVRLASAQQGVHPTGIRDAKRRTMWEGLEGEREHSAHRPEAVVARHMALPACSSLDHDITNDLPARSKRLLWFPVQLGTNSARVPKGDGKLILRLPLRLLTWAQQRFLGAA